MLRIRHRHTVRFRWEFAPRYLLLGVYWERWPTGLDLYLCLLPMLPLLVEWQWD